MRLDPQRRRDFCQLAFGKRFDPLQLSDQQISVPNDVVGQLASERVQHLGGHAVRKSEHLVKRVRECVQIMADDDVHARAARVIECSRAATTSDVGGLSDIVAALRTTGS